MIHNRLVFEEKHKNIRSIQLMDKHFNGSDLIPIMTAASMEIQFIAPVYQNYNQITYETFLFSVLSSMLLFFCFLYFQT